MDSAQILALNAFEAGAAPDLTPALDASVRRRGRLFGAASVLFYDQPLEFVRAAGVFLYEADGSAYLDAYNNVPSVGHCHPHVVQAVARQLGELNVHNRYLHEGTLRYAERLLEKFPAALSNITFTCTGSESNDLALRLAATVTGARGIIVTESAYHGNTSLVTAVSPTLIRTREIAPWVRYVPAPGVMGGGRDMLPGDVGTVFAGHVTAAIRDLQRAGVGCAALLVDSIFSSDGVVADPPGFLRAAADAVHAAGGLFIADEVQPGFGRTGSWWGFERHGVAPDVITLGKPMGNGYPLGAVLTRPEILAAFCAKFGYFNTFAGTPAAAAAGAAVLDVIEGESLLDNARQVGEYLRRCLDGLAALYPEIADVRGAGLYMAVELGRPAEGRPAAFAPAPELAKAVINGLRARHVLIGAAGKFGNVLKIRPPLCFSKANVDTLVAALDEVLTGVARGG